MSACSSTCRAEICPRCGRPNGCALATPAAEKGACWCFKMDLDPGALAKLPPELKGAACLCRACLVALGANGGEPVEQEVGVGLVAGRDYETDGQGMVVFTAAYLQARGHCCDSGCRHCPW
ncbi:MAG: cysteine-rich CWC family protein [Verrucomicrobia bacterium]|nr:cysteine-rich CWC family protein [Verrucomicrobiota bacterium]